MDIILVLIPMALLLGLAGLVGFVWSLKSGQFDDPEGNAARILQNDRLPDDPLPDDPAPGPLHNDPGKNKP